MQTNKNTMEKEIELLLQISKKSEKQIEILLQIIRTLEENQQILQEQNKCIRDRHNALVDTVFDRIFKSGFDIKTPISKTEREYFEDMMKSFTEYKSQPEEEEEEEEEEPVFDEVILNSDISEATLSGKAALLSHWLQHIPTVTGKLARGDRDFILPFHFVTVPATMIYDVVKDSHDKYIKENK